MTTVTDEQADALKALCLRDQATFQAMLGRVESERTPEALAFVNFVATAFVIAVERKFKDGPDSHVIQFVADTRSLLSRDNLSLLDAEAGEAMIRYTLDQIDDHRLDGKTRFDTELALIIALLAGPDRLAELDDEAEIDKFVAEARQWTDRVYAKRAAEGRPVGGA